MSLISGKYWTGDLKIKPDAWGPFEDVQAAVRENADSIYGIDPEGFAIHFPLWSLVREIDAAYEVYNYGYLGRKYQFNFNYSTYSVGNSLLGTSVYSGGSSEELTTVDNFINNVNEFTISAYVLPTKLDSDMTIVGRWSVPSSLMLHLDSNNKIRFIVYDSNNNSVGDYSLDEYVVNKPCFVTARLKTDGEMAVFINGSKSVVRSGSQITTSNNPGSTLGILGDTASISNDPFSGYMSYLVGHTKGWSDSGAYKMYEYPYGLLQPITRRSYFIPNGDIPVFNLAALHASKPTRIIQ